MEDLELSLRSNFPDLQIPPSVSSKAARASALKKRAELPTPATLIQSGHAARIVIADDETIFRDSLRVFLQTANGFEVVGDCSDAYTALELARRLKPDILLLDHNLPRDGGLDVLAELRKSEVPVNVVLLSMALTPDETVRALRSGVRGIVLKTDSTSSLIDCIQKVMQNEFWLGKDCVRNLVQAVSDFREARIRSKNRYGLTSREIEIVQAVLDGYSNPEIAVNFSLSQQTVKHHLSHVFDKLGVYSRLELALFATNNDIGAE